MTFEVSAGRAVAVESGVMSNDEAGRLGNRLYSVVIEPLAPKLVVGDAREADHVIG
jgi:hypothetical protein